MKRNKSFLGLFILFVFCVQALTVLAQGDLISPKELTGMMNDNNVIIVSGRNVKDYKKVHIEGAVNIWHKDMYKDGEIKGLLKSSSKLAKLFGKQGISEKKTIVVYDEGKNKASGRLYWVFKYLGCKNVKLLNGGLKSWRGERNPLTKKATKIKAATFVPKVNKEIIVSMKYIKQHLKDSKVVIVDARSKDEYSGKKGEIARKGHIPGAIEFEFKKLFNKKGVIKPKAELEKLTKAAGITSNKEIILYCETSVRAGIVFMVLKSILKYPKVKVYDGAFYEWSADASNPVK